MTFATDVAPLVHRECAPCHHPGGPGPFPLLKYEDVRRRAREIVRVTTSGFMPPWLPTADSAPMVGERRLTVEEIELLRRWQATGARLGDPDELPPVPEWPSGWPLGPPDLIVESEEPLPVPAEGPDVFRNLVLRTAVGVARWVRAVDFRFRPTGIVHHAILQVDESGAARRRAASEPGVGFAGMDLGDSHRPDDQFVGWTPGRAPDPGLAGIAWRLAPGMDLVLQLHVPPTGRLEAIHVEIGLYYAEQPPDRFPFGLMLGRTDLDIAPGDTAYRVHDALRLPVAVEVLGLYPHAHYLARRMGILARLPSGDERTLLAIDDWDFAWQEEYRLQTPMSLPAGTELSMEYTYDNSAANPRNPHVPPRRVRYGYESADEMAFLLLRLLPSTPADRSQLQMAQLRHTLQKTPDEWRARRSLGRLLLDSGRFDEAIAELETARQEAPDDAVLLAHLGLALGRSGRSAEALAVLARATRLDPDLVAARINYGIALEASGRRPEAEAAYRAALAREPTSVVARLNLGRLLAAQGRTSEAVVLLRQARESLAADDPLLTAIDGLLQRLAPSGR